MKVVSISVRKKTKKITYFENRLPSPQSEQAIQTMKETERGREIMRRAVEDFGNKKKSEGRIEGIKEGKIEGIKEGIIEGIREGKIETAKNMMAEGMGISFISKILKVPESCLNEWLA